MKVMKSEVDKFLEENAKVTSADIGIALAPLDKKKEFSPKRKFKGMTPLLTALFRYIIENTRLHMWSPSQELLHVAIVGKDVENGIITIKAGRKKNTVAKW